MELSLRAHYRIETIPIIRSFVTECAIYFGANQRETFDLALAAEEASEHIITTYPPQEADDPFDIRCETDGAMLRFIFSNTGLPVNEKDIPEYDSENPECSMDGLQFFLLEKLTDDFRFVNLGVGGWRTVIGKNICELRPVTKPATSEPDEESSAPKPKKVATLRAEPEDAYEITKLAYHTYRYSYAKKSFYYPEMLEDELAKQLVISFIGKTDDGEIIAHCGILRSTHCREIAECGAIMSKPEYRTTMTIPRLVKMTNNFLLHDNPGIDLLDANLVTTHTGSQRICTMFKFKPFAIKLSVHEHAKFIDIESDSNQRESLLYSILSYKNPEFIPLNIPKKHTEIVSELFDNAQFKHEIKTQEETDNDLDATINVERIPDKQFSQITVTEFGKNLPALIKKTLYDLSLEKTMTIFLKIPAWKPHPPDMEERLSDNGFFFAGLIPSTPKEWHILYVCVKDHKIDFDPIKMHDPMAIKLKEYVTEKYAEVIP